MASNLDNLFDQFATGATTAPKPDYTQNFNAKTVLKDPRFLTDLRDFYESRGVTVDKDDDLIDKFYSDNVWADSNIVSAAAGNFGLATSSMAGDEQRMRMGRIRRVWEQLPYFWQEGGRGWTALPEYLIAGALDPTNLLVAGKAAAVGANAGRQALLEGTSQTAMDAAMAGARAAAPGAAVTEGALSAGQSAVQSVFEQNRDTQLGLQDGFSATKLAAETAAGGVIGGLIGGGVGGVVGGVSALRGAGEAAELTARGLSPDQINALSPEQIATFRSDPSATYDTINPTAPQLAAPSVPLLSPETQTRELADRTARADDLRLNSYLLSERQKYDELQTQIAAEKDADKAGELRERVAILEEDMLLRRKLIEMGERLTNEEAEINQLRASNDPSQQSVADRRALVFERDFSEYRRLAQAEVPDGAALDGWLEAKRADALAKSAAQAEAAKAAPADAAQGADATAGAPSAEAAAEVAPAVTAPYVAAPDVNPAPAPAPARRGRKAAAEPAPAQSVAPGTQDEVPLPQPTPEAPKAALSISPDVQALAFERGVDLYKVKGSGPSGEITDADVKRAARRAKGGDPDFIASRDGYQAALDDLYKKLPDANLIDQMMANDAFMAEFLRQHPKVGANYDRVMSMHRFLTRPADSASANIDVGKMLAKSVAPGKGYFERVQGILKSGRVFNEGTADEYSIVGKSSRTGETRRASQVGDIPTAQSMGMEEARAIGLDYDRLKRQYETAVRDREKFEERGDANRTTLARKVEEGALKALQGRGPVVPFTANTTLTSVEGGTIRKGQTAYMESRSGKVFSDAANAYRARGEVMPAGFGQRATPQTEATSPQEKALADAMAEFLTNKDFTAFIKRMAELQQSAAPAAPEAPRRGRPPKVEEAPSPETVEDLVPPAPVVQRAVREPDISPDFTPPLTRGDMKLVVHKKGTDLDYRSPSDKQIAEGASILNIISRADKLSDYDWRYVPRDTASNRYALKAAFARSTEVNPAPAVQRVSATSVADLKEKAIPVSELSPEEQMALANVQRLIADPSGKAGYYARILRANDPITDTITGWQLHGLIKSIEFSEQLGKGFLAAHPRTYEIALQFVDTMSSLHRMMERFAPNGILFTVDERKAATTKLTDMLKGSGPEVVEAARQMLSRLGGDPNTAPEFNFGRSGTGWSSNLYSNGKMDVSIGRAEPANLPDIAALYHETAHWAYDNILTPADRAEFWQVMRKYYDPSGPSLEERSPTIFDKSGNQFGPSNALNNTQEFFANQFSMWAMQKRAPKDVQEQAFWERMTSYVKAIYDRYFAKDVIDPDLEPLFAKILPDDERTPREVVVRKSARGPSLDDPKMLDMVEPEKKAIAQTYQFHHNMVKDLQSKWAEAGDDPGSLLSVARETAEYIVGSMPYDPTRATEKKAWFPYRKIYKLGRDRLADINTILKDGYPESVLKTDGSTGFINDAGQRLSIDEARAEMLRDLFDFGHGGAYKGSRSDAPKNTSLDVMLGMMLDKNERGFSYFMDRPVRTEAVPPSLKPSKPGRARDADIGGKTIAEGDVVRDKPGKGNRAQEERVIGVTTDANGRPVAILSGGKVIDNAGDLNVTSSRKKEEARAASGSRDVRRKASAVSNSGTAEAAARAVREAKATPKAAAVERPAPDAPSTRSKDFFDLIEEMNGARDEARRAQLAGEILSKAKATSVSIPNVAVPEGFLQLSGKQLEGAFQLASINGDVMGMHQAAHEIYRRQRNRSLAAQQMPTIKPVFTRVVQAIRSEIADNTGVSADPSIPASARPMVRDLLSHIVHRDPEIERGARTVAYRLLNLMGRTQRDPANGNLITVGDLERATGTPTGRDDLAFDMRDPSFAGFRRHVRQLAASLETGSDSPDEVLSRVVKTVSRVSLDDAGRAALEGAHARAKATTPTTPGFEDWLADRVVAHASGRAKLNEVMPEDTGAVRSVASLEAEKQALRNLMDSVAFVTNGVVGRADIRNRFPRITFYGDMFKVEPASPMASAVRSQVAASPDYAAGWAQAMIAAMPPSRIEAVARWAGRGVGENGKALWTTRSAGFFFDRKVNADAPFSLRETGDFGPGLYVFDNPNHAAKHEGLGSLDDALATVANAPFNDAQRARVSANLERLFELRDRIGDLQARFVRAADVNSPDDAPDLRNRITNLIAQEQDVLRAMALDGFGHMPLAAPVFVRAQNMARFTRNQSYPRDGSFVNAITRNAVENSIWTADEATNFMRSLGNETNGADLYNALVRIPVSRGLAPEQARTEANRIMAQAGYEGLTVRDRNDATMHVLFEGDAVRHINSSSFDAEAVLPADADTGTKIVGVVMNAIAATPEKKTDLSRLPLIGEMLDQMTTDKSLVSAVTSLARGRKISPDERVAVSRASDVMFASNSERHRKLGMNWIADWMQTYAPAVNERLGKTLYGVRQQDGKVISTGLVNILRELPDAPSWGKRWFSSVTAGKIGGQPASYTKITKAMRYGPSSRFASNLNEQEANVFGALRKSFGEAYDRMKEAGVMVGFRRDYFPQVWSPDAIRKNPDGFRAGIQNYLEIEAARSRRATTPEEMSDLAQQIYIKLTEEGADGLLIQKVGSTRNVTSDNIDYNRMIELDQHPEALPGLEDFLEKDLESMLVKYHHGVERRIQQSQKFGVSNHAYYDYMKVTQAGERGIADLLTTRRIQKKDARVLSEDGTVDTVELSEEFPMPFEGRYDEAMKASAEAVRLYNEQGAPAAREFLLSLGVKDMRTGKPSFPYARRVDAIVGALDDYGGEAQLIASKEYAYSEKSMQAMMGKPLYSGDGAALAQFSRGLRAFNAVSLLSWTVLTSLPDLALPAIRSGDMKAATRAWARFLSDPDYKRMIRSVGSTVETIVNDRMAHLYGGSINKATNAFFNATMLTPWTDMNRQIATAVGYESFKTMQVKAQRAYQDGIPLSEQNRDFRMAYRFLQRYGLGRYATEATSLSDEALLVNDQALRLGLIRFADEAIFAPNPNDVPLWAQTPVGGLLWQFKAYPIMMGRMAKQVVRDAVAGDPRSLALMTTLGPAAGMAVLSVKDIVQSRGGEDEKSPEVRKRNLAKWLGYDEEVHGNENDFLGWYAEGLMTMGGFGLIADLAHSTATNIDNGAFGQLRILSTIFGPSVGTILSATSVVAGVVDTADSNAKERMAARELIGRVPGFGGNAAIKEGFVDAVAGEAQGRKKSGWGSGGFGSGGWG